MPQLIASSVVRGTQLGESHGGLYLVDLEHGRAELKLDWNSTDIDIAGRGGDRGLRGIAVHGKHILVAANSQLLMLDMNFQVIDAFSNPYLRHCHEICIASEHVFLTATGFDSILMFDLREKRFVRGFHLGTDSTGLALKQYDLTGCAGPAASNRFHLNSITASAAGIWFSGLHTPGLLHADGKTLSLIAPLPRGTHNAQLFEGGLLYNDTASDRICYCRNGTTIDMDVPRFDRDDIVNIDRFSSAVARPGFARGLCLLGGNLVAGGSSPSTISVCDLRDGERVLQHTLSIDVRNAIHGLAVWPS